MRYAATLTVLAVSTTASAANPPAAAVEPIPAAPAATANGTANQALAEMVASRLRAAAFRGFDVAIEVRGGHILLIGYVRTEADVARAGEIATDIGGVSHVENRLVVRPHSATESREADFLANQERAEAVAAAFHRSGIAKCSVDIEVDGGLVRLTGRVPDPAELARLCRGAAGVEGVRKVEADGTAVGPWAAEAMSRTEYVPLEAPRPR